MKRLALARGPEDSLGRVVREAGWEPVSWAVTAFQPTLAPMPCPQPRAALVLSPSGAREAQLPQGLPCLVTGAATAEALPNHPVLLSPEPRAEGLWVLLQERFPEGGDFLLIRGERSRGFLEDAARDTAWRLHPWVTHREAPLAPPPPRPELEAVLALSPLQAECLAPLSAGLQRFAWGERAGEAFRRAGAPPDGVCEARPEALRRLLEAHA